MSQTKAQLLDNIKDNVQLDARNSLRFADTDSSHYVAFKAPATVSSNVTWTLPAADGSANYVLATDGSGTLSWIADPAGQWTTSGSNIYFTGGNVGIGDTSPSNPLSVTGASAFNGDVTFTGASYNVTWDKSADDLIFNDNAQAAFGTSSDLTIFHDGSNSYIKDVGTGNLLIDQSTANVLYLRSDDLRLSSYTGTETYIDCNVNGAVELYYDNSKKLSTDSNGVKINSSSLYIDSDNEFVAIGAGDDLKLKHNGSNSYITNTTGALLLRSDTITFESAAGDETYIDCNDDGAVEFYYDGVKTCYTGTNSLKFDDDKKAIFGGNLEIYHSSNVNTINLTGKELQILGGASNNKKIFAANTSNAAELYHDNVLQLFTKSTGAEVTTTGAVANFLVRGKEGYGASLTLASDDGDDPGDYARILQHTDEALYFQVYNAANSAYEDAIVAKHDGAVEIYHDNSKQFQSNSNGILLNGGAKITRSANSNNTILETTNSAYAKSLYIGGWDSSDTAGISRIRNSNDNLHIDSGADGHLYLQHYCDGQTVTKHITPANNDTYDLGSSSSKWDDIYATNGTIQTSDRNQKNTIVDSDLGLSFVNKLKPVSYKYNGKTRTHYGLIAQDVETVLSDISKPTTGFAGFIKEAIPDIVYQEAEANIPEGKKEGDLKVAAHTEYGLRYGEFIAPLIKAVQELSAEVETLKTKVAALESA